MQVPLLLGGPVHAITAAMVPVIITVIMVLLVTTGAVPVITVVPAIIGVVMVHATIVVIMVLAVIGNIPSKPPARLNPTPKSRPVHYSSRRAIFSRYCTGVR